MSRKGIQSQAHYFRDHSPEICWPSDTLAYLGILCDQVVGVSVKTSSMHIHHREWSHIGC